MIKMGLALMYLSLAGILSEFIVKIFISHTTGIDSVGIFQAGSTIIIAYFGIITTGPDHRLLSQDLSRKPK